MARLLVVDDEPSLCQMLEIAFRKDGHTVETVSSGQSALKKIDTHAHDLIISDIRMPDLSGIDLLKHARATGSPAAFILSAAVPTMTTAVQALNLGAYRYVIKTDKLVEELRLVVERALEELALREENLRLRRELLRVFAHNNIVGRGPKIQAILEMVRTVAPTTSTILITGESGTGKELVARAIHEPVDVRLIASTNRALAGLVKAGQFREDFYSRVSVVPIHVPPLRERPEDIEPLARHFLQKFALQMGKPLHDFDREAMSVLTRYSWPGNVRELENAIERVVAVNNGQDSLVRLENLPDAVRGSSLAEEKNKSIRIPAEGIDFESQIATIEKQYLQEALRVAGGVRTRAAELLHVSYRSFRHYAKKYDL